ncbi:MAG: HlyD family efflux transporter periplasmic adaptor subunit, partial [Bacteroidia bacterium]|nr:HlyD family efflux transporter periplasmic adaptor subunit [Bacteroidia bacterium]
MSKNLILLSFLVLAACSAKKVQEVQTTIVKRGTFTEELTEQGTVRAVNSVGISAPSTSYRYGVLKISRIVEDGQEVDKGDTLVIFDPSEFKKAIINSQQQLEIAKAEYDKLKATQESEIEDLEADLEIARLSQEISKINFDQAVFESEITRKEINLKLETANIALERAREQIGNRKKIQQQELIQKSLTMKQNTTILDEANRSINSLFLVSPSKGIAILRENWMTGQKLRVGDQPYGGSLIELPDLSEMLAEVKINEVDISKITPDLSVVIKADAYSDSTYTGKISTVANLAQNKDYESKIKIFPVQIKIDGIHKSLLPGLTVSCKIKIREIKDVLFIPVEGIFKSQGMEYVYVKSGSGFKRKDVKIGAINTDYAVVDEGLAEKDEVALSDP